MADEIINGLIQRQVEAAVERCAEDIATQVTQAVVAERERLIAFIRKFCDDINATGDWPPAYVADHLITAIREGE